MLRGNASEGRGGGASTPPIAISGPSRPLRTLLIILGVIAAIWLVAGLLPAAAGTLPKAKPEDVGMSSERLARVNDVVKKAIDAGEVAGVVTLVARRGKVVHFEAQGYADIAAKKPMRTDNIFRLASMGKPVAYKWGDTEVQFCCPDCVKDFEKEPEKYLAKVRAATAAK